MEWRNGQPTYVAVTREAATNVEQRHVESHTTGIVEDPTSNDDSLLEGCCVQTPAANVERDTDHVELQALGGNQEFVCLTAGHTKLQPKLSNTS